MVSTVFLALAVFAILGSTVTDSLRQGEVEVDGDSATARYVRRPFQREPDFGVTSVNYALDELLARAEGRR